MPAAGLWFASSSKYTASSGIPQPRLLPRLSIGAESAREVRRARFGPGLYSVTFGQLRAARAEHRRATRPPASTSTPGAGHSMSTVLVLPTIWSYEGTARAITPDAELAEAAAARAREHAGQADSD
jgi:hypothetical protein